MRIQIHHSAAFASAARKRTGGFTLTEMLTAATVFVLLVAGIISANLYGLSTFRITENKLNATADARQSVGKLVNEIRTCKKSTVGSVRRGMFAGLLDGEKQQGPALLIYPTTNKTDYIIYFVDPSDQSFRRTTSKPKTVQILAENVTNNVVFRAQDFTGKMLTNRQNNYVIHFNLDFYQPARFLKIADCYKLETSVTRRLRE